MYLQLKYRCWQGALCLLWDIPFMTTTNLCSEIIFIVCFMEVINQSNRLCFNYFSYFIMKDFLTLSLSISCFGNNKLINSNFITLCGPPPWNSFLFCSLFICMRCSLRKTILISAFQFFFVWIHWPQQRKLLGHMSSVLWSGSSFSPASFFRGFLDGSLEMAYANAFLLKHLVPALNLQFSANCSTPVVLRQLLYASCFTPVVLRQLFYARPYPPDVIRQTLSASSHPPLGFQPTSSYKATFVSFPTVSLICYFQFEINLFL